MPRSDRLKKASASETPEGETAVSEAAAASDTESVAPLASEAVVTPEAEAAPTRKPRTRRPRAATTESPAAEAPAQEEAPPAVKRIPRMLERYRSQVKETLREEFGYRNVMQVPRIEKVVLNIGLGESKTNPRAMENATRDLSLISTQKPMITRARRSIAGFKLREGDPIGVAVTLRGNRMYEFMDRLVNAALPRIRDFRGVSRTAFDGRGNYSLGIREQVIFPEIDYGQIDRIRSLQVSIITSASTDREAMRLLDLMGVPFSREAVGTRADGDN